MARLQILELPEGSGDDRPPFILVIDEYEPRRYMLALGDEEQVVDEFAGVAEKIGARQILAFVETVDIPANGHTAHSGDFEQVEASSREGDRGSKAEAKLKALFEETAHMRADLEEARMWARHGYEIGQRHCSWSDHGVAPAWLTEGWPPHFDSCEHLKRAAEYEEALTRVRNLSIEPELMDARQEHPSVWRHGHHCGVLAAKAAARARNEEATKP